MTNNKPTKWADATDANLKEPIESLRQRGWQYGDVPTASNFNWILNKMTEDVTQIDTQLNDEKKGIEARLAKQSAINDNFRRALHWCIVRLNSRADLHLHTGLEENYPFDDLGRGHR